MPQDMIGCRNQREVESAYSSANDRPSAERRILLSFLLFYGLVVEKFALKCAMEIQKIQLVVQDLLHGARILFPEFPIISVLCCCTLVECFF